MDSKHDPVCDYSKIVWRGPKYCHCELITAVRQDERAKIYSKVSKLQLPSYLSNQLLRLDDVTDLLRGGEQDGQ